MSPPRLEGKVAIITGAAGGIGRAAARRLAEEGALLLLTDADARGRRRARARSSASGASSRAHDVTSEADWQAVVSAALEHPRARSTSCSTTPACSSPHRSPRPRLEDFRRVIDVNVVGVFLGMRAVAPAMTEQRAGSIINVSSVAGLMGSPYLVAYAASKWAVRGMTKVAAKELAQFGVRVNSLHPGQIDTDMNARQRERTPELIDKLIRAIPLRRIGTPQEIAHAVVYLASDESIYATGSELVLDGGTTA